MDQDNKPKNTVLSSASTSKESSSSKQTMVNIVLGVLTFAALLLGIGVGVAVWALLNGVNPLA